MPASVASRVEVMIAKGQSGADLVDWAGKGDAVQSIERARRDLALHGWEWVEDEHEFQKNGWRVFFRPQGAREAPIVQWCRIPEDGE